MAKKKAEVPEHEQVTLEPELEEALKNATDAEMCDIAGETNRFWIIPSGSWGPGAWSPVIEMSAFP